MNLLSELSEPAKTILMVVLLFLTGAQMSWLACFNRKDGAVLWRVICAVLLTVSAGNLMILLAAYAGGLQTSLLLSKLPAIVPMSVGLLPAAAFFVIALRAKRSEPDISERSIRQSVDNLPSGLCFAREDGLPLLVNRAMDALCRMLTGQALLNAEQFWKAVQAAAQPDVRKPETYSVQMENGRVWSFSRKIIVAAGTQVTEIIASDATDLYRLSEELRASNRRLEDMNQRLHRFSENVSELTRQEEILAAKVNIHDEIGQALLASQYELQQPELLQTEQLDSLWRQNIALLRREAKPAGHLTNPLQQLTDAAAAVGIEIMLDGTLPQEDLPAMRLIFAAARECLTNCVRHAGASRLYIRIREKYGCYETRFTNDGKVPDGEVTEGGGLSGLRRRVTDAGGTMRIETEPQFALVITGVKEKN